MPEVMLAIVIGCSTCKKTILYYEGCSRYNELMARGLPYFMIHSQFVCTDCWQECDVVEIGDSSEISKRLHGRS